MLHLLVLFMLHLLVLVMLHLLVLVMLHLLILVWPVHDTLMFISITALILLGLWYLSNESSKGLSC